MINFNFIPSLQNITHVKVAGMLWNHGSVRSKVLSLLRPVDPDKHGEVIRTIWSDIQDAVAGKALNLSLPVSLAMDLQKYIYGAGWEIFIWMNHYSDSTAMEIKFPRKLFWTDHGTLDERAVAEVLVNGTTLHYIEQFKLACAYCLKEQVITMSCLTRRQLNEINHIPIRQYGLVLFWKHRLSQFLGYLDMKSAFPSGVVAATRFAVRSSRVAAEHFWGKQELRAREKASMELVISMVHRELGSSSKLPQWDEKRYAAVFCYFLSLLDIEQIGNVIRCYPYPVLRALLHWPFQNFFIEVATHMWDYLTMEQYDNLFQFIINERIKAGFKDHDYRELVFEFWNESPPNYRDYVKQKCAAKHLLYPMCIVREEQCIKMILSDMNPEIKHELILSESGEEILKEMYKRKEFVKYFLKECLSSRKEVMDLIHYASNLNFDKVCKKQHIWASLLHVLEDIFSNYVQTECPNDDQYPAKRPRLSDDVCIGS